MGQFSISTTLQPLHSVGAVAAVIGDAPSSACEQFFLPQAVGVTVSWGKPQLWRCTEAFHLRRMLWEVKRLQLTLACVSCWMKTRLWNRCCEQWLLRPTNPSLPFATQPLVLVFRFQPLQSRFLLESCQLLSTGLLVCSWPLTSERFLNYSTQVGRRNSWC